MPALLLLGVIACAPETTATLPTPSTTPSAESPSTSPQPPVQGGMPGAAQPSSSPPAVSGPPPATSYAVLVDLFAGGNSYNVALAGGDARVVARAQAAKRTEIADAVELPYVSVSKSRVYYLDGDKEVRFLKADGTSGIATSISGGAKVHAAFAVSPDDSRIAVTLLDYSVTPVALTLYVEDMGGAHHAVIFTSTTKYLWPVAWHAGQLVVAYLGPNSPPFKSKAHFYLSGYSNHGLTAYPYGPSPYGGINFHVIDPVTAIRQAIISGGGASGLLTKSGTAVVQGVGVDWTGAGINPEFAQGYGSYSAAASLSPNGKMIAACCPQPASKGPLVIWTPGSDYRALPIMVTTIDWVGWLDNGHVVAGFYQSSEGTPAVVDVSSGAVKGIDAHGIVAAIFPSDLDS
ncbi:MAG: hypothetical protein PVS2B1_13760 [Candidatus Dormibacteraceae bacterium]